ncbi:flagellar protein MotY [Ferrimonas pelagia]|uniref:Flagellar protein MotY n=1 Tax=Ferrimonas pelagia TaxID=1177826 RepID=A0ABP9ESI4_9GAMM
MRRWALALVLISCGSHGGIQHYAAPIEQAQWQLETSSPLQCVLSHEIPRYGKARFISRAHKQLNLNFSLQMLRKPEKLTPVTLRSVAPAWRPGVTAKTLTQLSYYSHFDGELGRKDAWMMIGELEQGMQPTFFYQDWHSERPVSVGLSVANFGPGYQAFVECVDGLLPYSFDDIAFTVLHHDKSGALTRDSEQRLQRIIDFLELDLSADLVLIDTYTDSYSSEVTNMALTRQQANELKAMLISEGIPERRILTQGHGEKRHIASNRTERDRQLNRRVMIRIEQQ